MSIDKLLATVAFVVIAAAQIGSTVGAESATSIRRQMVKAEQEFITLYNKLNADPRFEVDCRQDRPTGSNFSLRVCEPRYRQKAKQAAVSDRVASVEHAAAGGEGPSTSGAPPASLDEGYRQNVLDLMQKSAELRSLGEKRDALQKLLDNRS